MEFVVKADFGLASGQKQDGTYERVWFDESLAADEVTFEAGVFLLTKGTAQALKAGGKPQPPGPIVEPKPQPPTGPTPEPPSGATEGQYPRTLRLAGPVPPELWNRLGTRILPKLRAGSDLRIGVDFSVTLDSDLAQSLEPELRLILQDLGLSGKIQIEDVEKTE